MPETVNELNTTKEACIEKFRNATFGEEVRGALIDLANLVYTDVINAALSGLKKGDSITNVSIQNGDLILEITSYDIDSDTSTVTTKNLGNIIGPTGQDGPTGPMGPQGNSITAVDVDSNGDLYVTIGSGTPTLIGNIKGPKGDTGATGPKGDPGDVGPEHEWSIDGSLSPTSENPVQNRAIYNELQGKQDKLSPNDAHEITIVGNRGQIKASGRTINYESTLNPVSYNSVPTEGTVANYTYSKTESDARFAGQTDLNNYYNKNESDTKYLSKNDANNNYYTKSQSDNKYLTEHQDISGKQDKLSRDNAGKVTIVGNNGAIKATNFSIDDIEISELASQTITTHDKVANYTYSKTESDNKYVQFSQIDQELDDESNNPVANSTITQKIEQIENDYSAPDPTIDITSTKPVQNHAVAEALNGKVNISDFNNTIFDNIDLVFSNSNGGFYYNGECPAAPALFIEASEYESEYTYFLSYVDSLFDTDDDPHWHRIANITLLVNTIISIDSVLDSLSTHPVENRVVTEALNEKCEYKIIDGPINNIAGLNGYTDEKKVYIVDCNFAPIHGKARVIFVKSNDPQPGIDLYPNSAQFKGLYFR